jgi:hypothetical protein
MKHLLLVLFVFLSACAQNIQASRKITLREFAKFGAVEITPIPDVYREWWDSARNCLGLRAPYDSSWRYFVGNTIPSSWTTFGYYGTPKYYSAYANSKLKMVIFGSGHEKSRSIVTHEQVHLVLGGGHQSKYFDGRCGVAPFSETFPKRSNKLYYIGGSVLALFLFTSYGHN